MKNDAGYKNFKYVPLDPDEQAIVDIFHNSGTLEYNLTRAGFPAGYASKLKIDFAKATLNGLTPDEVRTGACHSFDDGQPFYRLTVSTTDNERPLSHLFLHLMANVLLHTGSTSMNLAPPYHGHQDFRGDLGHKMYEIAIGIADAGKKINSPRP